MTNASQFNARTMDVVDDEFQSVSEGRIRIRIGMVVYLFVLGLIIVRLAELSLFAAKDYRYQIPDRSKIYRTDIVDRNGELLASSLKTYALFAEPRRVWNPKESALKIASVLPDLDIDGLETKLSSDRAYIQLERGLTPKQKQRVFDLGLPGLKFPEEYKRVYPQGHLASHVVGFTNVDMEGLGGIERTMGERLMTTGAPELALSLDMRVQNAVSDELRRGLKKYEADSNAAVVLDIKLEQLDVYSAARQKVAATYDAAFKEIAAIQPPVRQYNSTHVFHQYTMQIKNGKRDELKEFLSKNGIPSMVYYPIPLYKQEAFKAFYKGDKLKVTEILCQSVLSLPIHTEMEGTVQAYIIEKVIEFFK